jgi:hypothetical protein
MTSQRDALRAFFHERFRGVAAITLLTGAIAVTGYVIAVLLVWVLS